jgi:UDP-N-acetylglucosamine--N-acetylmuramyl-(pentapeptide) pyrophosphoryl-undecaprenol N-acetylglucosamine transferase
LRHLVVVAAGTGGHIVPGLAVAAEMARRGWSVSWLGTRGGMENRLVPAAGIALDTVGFAGLRGKGLLQWVKGAFELLGACGRSFSILRRRGADAVLAMGGYVCVPAGLAAAALGRPLLLVNADAALLLSTRLLLPFAGRVAFGFGGPAAAALPRAVVTGNPVRREIEAIAEPTTRFAGRSGPLRLLVVGGSLGARAINDALPAALALVPPAARPQVTHQAGQAHAESLRAAYAAAGVDALVLPFIDDMATRLADCDLMLCRSGAITVSELCAAGVAAILVPLVVGTTAHQRDNAEYMARHGAAIHLPQAELAPGRVAALLQRLDRAALATLAARARTLRKPDAAARVADEIERLVAPREVAA